MPGPAVARPIHWVPGVVPPDRILQGREIETLRHPFDPPEGHALTTHADFHTIQKGIGVVKPIHRQSLKWKLPVLPAVEEGPQRRK